ncbi:CocE/NonD family hydrolase [Ornithinibacillus halotolerans]|uniref:Esterase n=1 Tax=Ornithinibacillus halotolerans TaxID=1274357 RepID=A0A916SAJ1_9BACI|nr:CocE/NonD family hydrolase [Ornithinibacillus halotolerans]GGA90833.1 esterase [Ornithinibacillus halotolerans]
MENFKLYRSGIHDATIRLHGSDVEFKERNVMTNQWQEPVRLNEDKATELENYYHINLLTIAKHLDEFRQLFQQDTKEVLTSWGATYQKHDENTWVERQKKYPLDVVTVNNEPVAFISISRENCSVFVKEGFEEYTPVKLWNQNNISKAGFGIHLHETVMVEMRDTIKLATDVWLPKGVDGPVPVILVRTPYGKSMYSRSYTNFIQRGYGVVIQDTRGREDSEGDWIPMASEIEDGDDTLDWIADQPWCDGNIGMIGASYGGYVQWAAAASGNPHLKAMVSIVTAGSPFIDIPRKGGTLVSGALAWAFAMVEKEFKPENMVRNDWDEVVKIRPLKDIPKRALGKDVAFWDDWMSHPTNDEFWLQSDWYQYKDKIKAPAMIVSGWYDDNGMGTTEALEVVENYPSENKKIILGPWMHNGNTTRDIQGIALGNNAIRYDMDLHYQLWFDRKLKGIENNIDASPVVEYYVNGDNAWTTANQWPPEKVAWKEIYVSGNGNAVSSDEDGKLSFKESTQDGYDEFIYDPENPAPHLIDLSENEIGVPANYKDVEKRSDVLVYTSDPLDEPLTIAGDIYVNFFASSSARDTDWVVRLTDVDAAGNSIKLADGVIRARFRNGYDKEVLLEPGKVEEYMIRTSKIANTFQKGHRIRLTITSSADSFVFPNSNTGENPATDIDNIKATQRIYHGKQYKTYVKLPVVQKS